MNRLSKDGFEVKIVDQPVDSQEGDGVVIAQDPAGGKAKRGSTVTLTVGRFNAGAATPGQTTPTTTRRRRRPRPRRRRREGRRPGRRPLVGARGLARVRGLGRRRPARGRPRGRVGRARARRHVAPRRGRDRAARPAAGCSAPTPCSRRCTARSARTARSRACSSCSTSRTSARACSRARVCMDKVLFKELMAHHGLPQVGYVAVEEGVLDGAVARIEELGLPCWVKPARLGSSVGIVRVGEARELEGALQTAFGHDPRVIVEAIGDGARGRVLGPRPDLRAAGQRPRRDRPRQGRRLVRLRGQVRRRRHGAPRARRGSRTSRSSACARWPSAPSSSRAAAAWRAPTSSSTATRCCSTSSTRCPGSRRRASTRSSGRPSGLPYPDLRRPARGDRGGAVRARSAGTGSERGVVPAGPHRRPRRHRLAHPREQLR